MIFRIQQDYPEGIEAVKRMNLNRHPGANRGPVISAPQTLDSGFRRNDKKEAPLREKGRFGNVYDGI